MSKTKIQTSRGLREFLVDQMEGVAGGEIETDRAKGVANIAQQIYNTMLIEVKMAKARSELGEDAIKSVNFGD